MTGRRTIRRLLSRRGGRGSATDGAGGVASGGPARESRTLPVSPAAASAEARPRDPLVCVVIVNWESWRYTLECLESLRGLAYPKVGVVVVDNASRNDSVSQLRDRHPDLRVLVTGRNLGYGGGCNVGIRHALTSGADYVWLLNNDVKVHPDALRVLVATAESDPGLGAVGSVLYHMSQPERVQNWGGGSVWPLLGILRPYVSAVSPDRLGYLSGASLLLRCAALEQVGLLDEHYFMYWEDVDLARRLRAAGWKLSVAAGAVVWHWGSGSVGGNTPAYHAHFNASAVRFFRLNSHWPPVPIAIGVGLRLVRRLVSGDWDQARAIWRSVR